MMDKPIHTVLISMIKYKKKDNLKLVYRFFLSRIIELYNHCKWKDNTIIFKFSNS